MGNADSSNPLQFVDEDEIHLFNQCCVPALEKLNLPHKDIKVFDFLEFNVNDPTKQLRPNKKTKINNNTEATDDKNIKSFVSFEEIVKLNYGTLQVGGKGLRLAQVFCGLNNNEYFSVPVGAVLTTTAYSNHLIQYEDLMRQIIESSSSKSTATQKIQELYAKIDQVEFDSQLKPIIEEFLKQLPPNSTVAVRSSATIEDAADFSLAGLCSSFLHVPAQIDEVVKNIKNCWKSLWQLTMTSFMNKTGKSKGPLPKMAVVIQQMVQSSVSGVLFTLNPSNGNEEEFYLEAVHGLGEGLVSGEISPHGYTLNWATKTVTESSQASQKKKYICAVSGVQVVATSPNEENASPLQGREFNLIREMGLVLARHYGHPQDVEWAIDAQGSLFMTQTRPITKYQCTIEGEWVSGFTYKSWLAMSLTSVAGYALFMRIMNRLDKRKFSDDALVKIKYGLAYINSDEHSKTYHDHQNSAHALNLYKVFSSVTKKYTDHYRDKMEPLLWQLLANIKSIDDGALANLLMRLWSDRSELTCHSFMTGFVARRYLDEIEREVSSFNSTLKSSGATEFIKMENLVTQIHPGTGEALRDLRVLAEKISQDVAVMKLIVQTKPENILAEIKNKQQANDFEEFFKKHFWFCDMDEDIQAVRWLDDPTFALTILQSELKKKIADPNYSFVLNEQESFDSELNRIKAIFKNNKAISKNWQTFESDLMQFRNYLYWKEDVHITYGRQNYFVCKMINELGSRWFKQNLLEDQEDIYYIGEKEFERIVTSKNLTQLKEAVFKNKFIRESLLNFEIPSRIANSEFLATSNKKNISKPGDKTLIGQGGSPGTVTGKARVITELDEADQVQPGEILVTHHTSPGWTPLFSLIAGLVTEEGGILSHGAVVAREFKIPAVLRVKNATSVVQTGQVITINGNSGHVSIQ